MPTTISTSTRSAPTASAIEVRRGTPDGPLLATCDVPAAHAAANVTCAPLNWVGGDVDIALVAQSAGIVLDSFAIAAAAGGQVQGDAERRFSGVASLQAAGLH